MNKPLILVVEDDTPVRNLITMTLKTHEYRYLSAQNGASAVMEALSHNPDIVLLDLGLPDMDGVEIIQKIRSWSNMPIIVISARTEDSDKIGALDAGADDYLTKPFYLKELKMRIEALLKRSGKFDQNTFSFGDVCVNLSTNSTYVGDKEVELLGKEFDLLVYFLQNQNVILPKSQIFDRLWGFDSDTNVSVVEVYVSKIRKKLKGTDFATNLQTLRSVGNILKNAD